jgi:hypothetical protein
MMKIVVKARDVQITNAEPRRVIKTHVQMRGVGIVSVKISSV